MEAEKMYLVINHAVRDYEDLGIGTNVFVNIDDAKQMFKKLVDDERNYIEEEWESQETDGFFEAYEDGYYARNHTMVEIREVVINTNISTDNMKINIEEVMNEILSDEENCDTFMEVVMEEIRTDEETYRHKAHQFIQAYREESCADLIMALCGWSMETLLAKYKERKGQRETDEEIVYEWCPHCEVDVKLKTDLIPQQCPECGRWICPCAMCEDCKKDCPLVKECDKLNAQYFND